MYLCLEEGNGALCKLCLVEDKALGLLGPAPRPDVKSGQILKGAGPKVWFGSWVLLCIKFLWILNPGAEQVQAYTALSLTRQSVHNVVPLYEVGPVDLGLTVVCPGFFPFLVYNIRLPFCPNVCTPFIESGG